MKNNLLETDSVQKIIDLALTEDIGSGDITTENIIPADKRAKAVLKVKGFGIIAGLPIAERVFKKLDPDIKWKYFYSDGAKVEADSIIAEFEGSYRALLSGERTALNFLQRMSGIATTTSRYVECLKGLNTKLLDTRKTVPGNRMLDKYAVSIGGGTNHRIGLFDMVLIKNNHITVAGGITKAIQSIKSKIHAAMKIEVETKDINEVKEALGAGADIIMLDNMTLEQMKEAVKFIDGNVMVEASGNITIDNVRSVAETGVDYISTGAITHSIKAMDISLYVVSL
ncbi:MAG: carboxylating nicotinate-nucleotide diphosphorylase [bacterium]